METQELKFKRIHEGKSGNVQIIEGSMKFVSCIGRNKNGVWFPYIFSLNKKGTDFNKIADKI